MMSKNETEGRELVPNIASSPVLVQVAGRQLALAKQLNQDIERQRLVAILKLVSSEDAV